MAPRRCHSASLANVMCNEDASIFCASVTAALARYCSAFTEPGPGRVSSRRPGTGVNGTAHCSFG